jgi:hypothetical protein
VIHLSPAVIHLSPAVTHLSPAVIHTGTAYDEIESATRSACTYLQQYIYTIQAACDLRVHRQGSKRNAASGTFVLQYIFVIMHLHVIVMPCYLDYLLVVSVQYLAL